MLTINSEHPLLYGRSFSLLHQWESYMNVIG